MKDKEKQIEEIVKETIYQNATLIIDDIDRQNNTHHYMLYDEDISHIAKRVKEKLPENSVVLSREEYERLSSSHDIVFCDNKDCPDNLLCRCCEISECPRNIPKYDKKLAVNKHKLDLFQKLCKERESADSWKDRYKLLQEELKQERKETAEKIAKYLFSICILADIPHCMEQYFKEQFGVEIKEN